MFLKLSKKLISVRMSKC